MAKECENCGNMVLDNRQIMDSHEAWGKVLCMNCQIKANEGELDVDSIKKKEQHNPLDCESIPDENTFEDIHGPIDEPYEPSVEIINPEELTKEQKLAVAELVNDDGYDKETAKNIVLGNNTQTIQTKPIPNGYIPQLSIQDVKMYLCPNATEQEAYVFLELCKARKLNPFTNEVYLIKYNASDKAQTVVGKETFTRRAEQHQMFDGFEAGIIVINASDEIERREGTFYLPDSEKIVGGWAKVYRKDRSKPFVNEVALQEYQQRKKDGTVNKMWTTKEGTLIRKVPLVQSLREAFPSEFGGLYDRSELDIVGD